MRGKWILISVLAVAAGVGAGAFRARWAERRALPPPVFPGSGALLVQHQDITFSGTVHPQHVIAVDAAMEGVIDAFLADVGDEVYEGQVLARVGAAALDSSRDEAAHELERAQDIVTRAESAVLAARAEAGRAVADAGRARLEMERAQKIFDRQATLHNAGATPRLTYEKAQRDFEAAGRYFETMNRAARSARAAVEGAASQLDAAKRTVGSESQELQQAQAAMAAAEVRAPAAGTIVSRGGEAGKPVADIGGHLFQIATDLYALEVRAEARPADVARIHPGQPALVLILDLQNTGLPGMVKQAEDGSVVVEFAGAIPGIKPGMRADVRVRP
jgi:multidrug resistance efflux pump